MRHLAAVALLALAGCANLSQNTAPPATMPENARPDLAAKWIRDGDFRWPPNDGFDGQGSYVVLPAGVLLDRFGSEHGRFFTPKGASFDARALPTVCASLTYTVYRVTSPLPVKIGGAAPWFDAPGGATQIKTDATAGQLVADGVLRRVPAQRSPCTP
ncbi:TNT domain-containing protein [Paracoccus sp. (in: a-proteobacteria)]|uniref:TNT domain-containing protein n=1 Tax=Paracoccus sp. TaxID=267 RepID=UPI00321FDBF6